MKNRISFPQNRRKSGRPATAAVAACRTDGRAALLLAALLPTLLIATAVAHASVENRNSYSASAYALDTEELLYVERHVETWRDGRLAERVVRYEDPTGELIAEKTVYYGEDSEAPSFEMTDHRIGLREGAEVLGDKVVLFSGPVGGEERAKSLQRPEVAVVDAGFDAFMRDNFESVSAGESIEFEFAVPALRRFLRFEIVPEEEVLYEGEPARMVKMRLASPLLRLLADPIQLVYSRDGRLLEFRGLANVWNEEGDRYEARIVFDYVEGASGGGVEVAP